MDTGIANRSGREVAREEPSTLRVGGIDYLNALPLTQYLRLDGSPPLRLENLVPSELAKGLRRGDLDVALVPVVEYLERDDYLILPDICVASYGAVESIRLYHRRPLHELRRIGLDTSSRTSVLLTRLLLRTHWRSDPELVAIAPAAGLAYLSGQEASVGHDARPTSDGPDASDGLGDLDAMLLIGDTALRQDVPRGWWCVDLGNEWTRLTGLPFVYAFWVCGGGMQRRGEATPAFAERFCEAREMGISHIDDIVRRYVQAGRGAATVDSRPCTQRHGEVGDVGGAAWTDEARWRDYLSRVIQYELGRAQIEALEHFFVLVGREGLHRGAPRPLRFVGDVD